MELRLRNTKLGGGFKYFLCSPLPGEMIQFDSYFSNGLKPPASNNLWNEQFEEDDVIVENGD